MASVPRQEAGLRQGRLCSCCISCVTKSQEGSQGLAGGAHPGGCGQLAAQLRLLDPDEVWSLPSSAPALSASSRATPSAGQGGQDCAVALAWLFAGGQAGELGEASL